jgi:ACS family glucarate transporter-like MFS transporter
MSRQAGATPASHFRRGWIYLLLLALVTINYLDRSTLGVVAQVVRSEFKLSRVQMGYLFSSFLWTYTMFILPIGIMLDRFSARSINSFGIAWSIVMASTALVGSFTGP